MEQALRFLRQIGTQVKHGCNSHTYWSVPWKQPCCLGKYMDSHTMPSDVCVAMYIDGPKQRNGNPPCGTDMPLDIIQRECLGVGRVEGCRRSDPFTASPFPLHLCGAAGVTHT